MLARSKVPLHKEAEYTAAPDPEPIYISPLTEESIYGWLGGHASTLNLQSQSSRRATQHLDAYANLKDQNGWYHHCPVDIPRPSPG